MVRPYPSLRILFASPDLRIPGTLQSPLLSRIGGSTRVRGDLAHALEVGRKVTAKVQWLSKTATTSQARWIHCTPLLNVNDTIGVWMVILVDDEDDKEEERDQVVHKTRSSSRWGSTHKEEALPWDEKRKQTSSSDISIATRGNTARSQISNEIGMPKKWRPMFRQPSEMDDQASESFVAGPGPKNGGRAFSVTSNSDQHNSVDEERRTSNAGAETRPTSQGSTFVPIQSTMQPKVKIAGRPSFDGDGARKAPINMPGRADTERETSMDGRPSARRTYKSLSPYGILFED